MLSAVLKLYGLYNIQYRSFVQNPVIVLLVFSLVGYKYISTTKDCRITVNGGHQCTVYSEHSVHTVQCTVYTVYSAQCTVSSPQGAHFPLLSREEKEPAGEGGSRQQLPLQQEREEVGSNSLYSRRGRK